MYFGERPFLSTPAPEHGILVSPRDSATNSNTRILRQFFTAGGLSDLPRFREVYSGGMRVFDSLKVIVSLPSGPTLAMWKIVIEFSGGPCESPSELNF
jgi:hypothetical protein